MNLRRPPIRLFLLTLTLAGAGCAPPQSAEVSVPPSGGTVRADGVALTIPAGALEHETAITVRALEGGAVPSGFASTSRVFEFLPAGLTFKSAVKVAFDVDPSWGGAVAAWTSDSGDGAFEPIASELDSATLSVSVRHFSQGVVGPRATKRWATVDQGMRSVAVGGGHVYGSAYASPGLMRFDSAGGAPVTFQAAGLTAAPVAADADRVYWVEEAGIKSARHDGSDIRVIAPASGVMGLAVNASSLFWIDSGTHRAHRVGKDGSNETSFEVGLHGMAEDMAATDEWLYWIENPGRVVRAHPDGTAQEVVVDEMGTVYGLAATPAHLYWTDATSSTLFMAGPDAKGPIAVERGLSVTGLAASDGGLYLAHGAGVDSVEP